MRNYVAALASKQKKPKVYSSSFFSYFTYIRGQWGLHIGYHVEDTVHNSLMISLINIVFLFFSKENVLISALPMICQESGHESDFV